jgi:hypothetical protein
LGMPCVCAVRVRGGGVHAWWCDGGVRWPGLLIGAGCAPGVMSLVMLSPGCTHAYAHAGV